MTINIKRQNITLGEILWILAVGFKPLYLGASGGAQISDLIFAIMFVAVFLGSPRLHPTYNIRKWLILFAGTLVYQLFISLIWQMITDMQLYSGNLIVPIAYYIFNFIIVCAVFKLNERVGFERMAFDFGIGILLSCVVCAAGMVLNPVQGIRQMGFFNNPNQLGYYSVIIYIWRWKDEKCCI